MASLSTAHPGDTAGSGRLLWLDVVKGVAIALVVINHAILWPMRAGSLTAAFLYGTCYGTVAAFAAVAGYISARKVIAERREFVRRRARQLLVPGSCGLPCTLWRRLLRTLSGRRCRLRPNACVGPWDRVRWRGAVVSACAVVVTVIATELDARTESWWLFGIGIGNICGIAGFALIASGKSMSPLAFGHGTLWATVPLYVACYWLESGSRRAPSRGARRVRRSGRGRHSSSDPRWLQALPRCCARRLDFPGCRGRRTSWALREGARASYWLRVSAKTPGVPCGTSRRSGRCRLGST